MVIVPKRGWVQAHRSRFQGALKISNGRLVWPLKIDGVQFDFFGSGSHNGFGGRLHTLVGGQAFCYKVAIGIVVARIVVAD